MVSGHFDDALQPVLGALQSRGDRSGGKQCFGFLSDYIQLNPARAGIVSAEASLADYPLSRFVAFLRGDERKVALAALIRIRTTVSNGWTAAALQI